MIEKLLYSHLGVLDRYSPRRRATAVNQYREVRLHHIWWKWKGEGQVQCLCDRGHTYSKRSRLFEAHTLWDFSQHAIFNHRKFCKSPIFQVILQFNRLVVERFAIQTQTHVVGAVTDCIDFVTLPDICFASFANLLNSAGEVATYDKSGSVDTHRASLILTKNASHWAGTGHVMKVRCNVSVFLPLESSITTNWD